jgi:2-succinyl-6-hydroxy-2,4-cyclohexadiene-1-carboxylate synthase
VSAFAVEVEGATLVGERRDGAGGVPLVLVHGFGGSRRDWDPVVQALPPSQPILSYDQRGFGESEARAGVPFSHGCDLIALLEALRIEQADLCGVSLGGATVLDCAIDAPQRVRRLVLVSPMLGGWSWSCAWVELWKAIGRAARAGNIEQARTMWYEHPLFAPVRAGPRALELRQSIAAFAGRQWVQDDQRGTMPMVERLHLVAAPTLLLAGGLDLPDFRLMADMIAGACPAVERIDDLEAGHLLTLERPDEVAAAMTAFLGRR